MQGKKGIAVVALTAAAAGGAAALLLSPGISFAQEDQQQTPSDAPTDSTSPAPEMPADGSLPPDGCTPDGRRGPGLDAAAEAIGIDVEDLVTALRDGQTIAEVAEAHGVDPDDVVAAMVADAEAHLDEAAADGRLSNEEADEIRADLPARIAELVENGPPAGGPTGPSGESPDSSPGRPAASVSV